MKNDDYDLKANLEKAYDQVKSEIKESRLLE
jgi:hypothetical protein